MGSCAQSKCIMGTVGPDLGKKENGIKSLVLLLGFPFYGF